MSEVQKAQPFYVKEAAVKEATGELIKDVFSKNENITEFHVGMVARHNDNNTSVAAVSFYNTAEEDVICHNAYGPSSDNRLEVLVDTISDATSHFEKAFPTK